MFLGIVVFLFLLAIFDLVVGVSNDAVNFMNSAIGAKAASFKTIIAIAAFGIFIGATLSNGMMEIARHGIFRPEQFYFQELMCIFLAVMVTDVVLLDIFNSLGMPTSTTVSMVFELLGGTFVLALIKIAGDETGMLGFADLLNTEKALSVILGIFLSVAVAFFFGTLVQYLSRLLFTFNYTKKLKYTIGLFGGIAVTAIIYFMLIKGLKDSAFMTTENKHWIQENTLMLVSCEHNCGLAADLNSPEHTGLDEGFEKTAAFRWLCEHAGDYGFILRYPKDAEDKTEIIYEPWHWRYVGVENAAKINASGLCFEDYIETLQSIAAKG